MFNVFPERASSIAGQTDSLFGFVLAVTLFFGLLVGGLMLYFGVRYRRRHEDEQPVQIEGNTALEIAWTLIPLVLAMVIFFWGAKLFLEIIRRPNDATPIYVVGKQWMWKIQYPDGRSEINELHVPTGQKFRLIMTSEDVIHSLFIPAFRMKMDVVPGRYSSFWFEAIKPGRYRLFCAQYCGTQHSGMTGWVTVMSPADYAEWLNGQIAAGPKVSMEEAGAKLFVEKTCITCHGGQPGAQGPNMRGVFGSQVTLSNEQIVTADETYVRESILKPQAKLVKGFGPVMPTFAGQVSEEQILQLIAYIKTLKPVAASGGKP